MNRCEDFPCCGHTYDDPCAGSTYDPYNDPHLMCDHNYGCELEYNPPEAERVRWMHAWPHMRMADSR